MNKPTPEQAKKLLDAIFAETDETDNDNYPETAIEKVGYAEYVLAAALGNIGRAIQRLYRLHSMLAVSEKSEIGLPPIIFRNELRMAIEALVPVQVDIDEITEMLVELYKATGNEETGEGGQA